MELTLILYGLIVAAPIAVLALLALLGIRMTRRRGEERLLERA
jgi:cyanate permease